MEAKNHGELIPSSNMHKVFLTRKSVHLSVLPENINLLGFDKDTMVFEKVNSENDQESPGKNALKSQQDPTTGISPSGCQKFLVLNGKKFRLIHDKSITGGPIDSTIATLAKVQKLPRKILPKIVHNNSGKCLNTPSEKVVLVKPLPISNDVANSVNSSVAKVNLELKSDISSKGKPSTFKVAKIHSIIQNQSRTSEISEDPKKSVTFYTSILKHRLEKTSSGVIRVINNVNKVDKCGVPLVNENKLNSVLDRDPLEMKLPPNINLVKNNTADSEGLCANCRVNKVEEKNLVTSATNTDSVESVDREIQTHIPPDPWESIFGEENELIIGDNVNMGSGPQAIHSINTEKARLQFYNDLKNCMVMDSGNLPIHKAVIQKDVHAVKTQCVVLKARKVGVNITNCTDFTPLQLAIIYNVYTEIVETLLAYGADMSVLDSEGNNVLHLAVQNNRIDLVEIFLNNNTGNILNVDGYNYDGLTPLMCCALHQDRIDIAQKLLEHGVQVNLRDMKSGRTAIFHAAEKHNTPMVSLLLDYQADTKIRNFFGTSVHDAMFELDDIPKEIKYPILGRDLRLHQKRKMNQEQHMDSLKLKKLETVPTYQKISSKINFVVNQIK